MEKIRYFDNAATTKISDDVLKTMIPYLTIQYGNPSSLYSIGRDAKRGIETARRKVAELIGAKPNEIYFTGCGSEADNMALKGIAYANKSKGNHIITSKIEHPAILDTCKFLEKQGFEVTYLNVDENGLISLSELENAITDKTILITIMFANNEIGTIEPIKEIGAIAKKHNVVFHTDAVQAVGNIKIDVDELNIDLLSM
jgi:cysteine desulfurase